MGIASEITLLQLNSDDYIHTFFKRVQDIQTKLQYSRENIDKLHFIEFFFEDHGNLLDLFPTFTRIYLQIESACF